MSLIKRTALVSVIKRCRLSPSPFVISTTRSVPGMRKREPEKEEGSTGKKYGKVGWNVGWTKETLVPETHSARLGNKEKLPGDNRRL